MKSAEEADDQPSRPKIHRMKSGTVLLSNVRYSMLDRNSNNFILNVTSASFDVLVGTVILLNAAVLGLEADRGKAEFVLLEQSFTMFFFVEMCMRIRQLGFVKYITKQSNVFDCLLVAVGVGDLYVLPLVLSRKQFGQVSTYTKLARVVRVLRIVRLFKVFRMLSVIMNAFMQALSAVVWVGGVTFILCYMSAIVLTKLIGHSADDWGESASEIRSKFGCIGHTLRTLFIILTLEGWCDITDVLSEQINSYLVFCVAGGFIWLIAFTMVSLITGIISNSLVTARRKDEILKIEEIEKGKKAFADGLGNLLAEFDEDGSGTLSKTEIRHAFLQGEEDLCMKLQALEIDMDDEDILDLIDKLNPSDDPNAEIEIHRVAEAMRHLRGNAQSKSAWDVQVTAAKLRREFNDRIEYLVQRMAKLEEAIDGLLLHAEHMAA